MNTRLSETQQQIVDHNEGAILVVAGPGSGKTRVVTERIRRLLSLPNEHFHVLALTFTNKAANEMKERLAGVEDIEKRAFIANLHSFCVEVLSNRGKPVGIETFPNIFESLQDRRQVLLEAALDDPLLNPEIRPRNSDQRNLILNSWLSMISDYKSQFLLPEMIDDVMEKAVYEAYNEGLKASNAIDFDDLLFLTYRLFIERPKIADLYRRQYKYLFVDEAQDINETQYLLIRAFCGSNYTNVMMVGDANQAIFTWNGADPKYLDMFEHDFQAKKVVMYENFRSSKAVVESATALVQDYQVEGSMALDGERRLLIGENEQKEAEYVIDHIESLLEHGHKDIEGNLNLNSFAIVARTKYLLKYMEQELISRNILYYKHLTVQDLSVSDLIQDFHLFLRILVNPKSRLHIGMLLKRWNINIDTYNEQDPLTSFLNSQALNDKQRIVLDAVELLNFTPEKSVKLGKSLDLLSNFAHSISIAEERMLIEEDIRSWGRHWASFVRSQTNHNANLTTFLTQLALGATQQTQAEGIALLTVHSSKGLEFDVVALVGMVEGAFPDYRATDSIQLSEEKRNAFVAITRSKRIIIFSYPKFRKMPWGAVRAQQPSRYLKEIGLE